MKNLCNAIMTALSVILLFVMITEAAPVDDDQELMERYAWSALDKRSTLNDLLYEYLLAEHEAGVPIYEKKRLSGLPGLDSISMISKARNNKHFKAGRRRRSLYDLE